MVLLIGGYNDKLQVLLVIKVKNFKVDPERFLLIKECLQRDLFKLPYQLSMYHLKYLTEDKM
jgi:hypothetical protein